MSTPPRILVVDDQSDALDLIATYLSSQGVEIDQASDGLDAISSLYASRPLAVLLDLVMPRMNGLELIEQIRGERSLADVPIIAMSGSRQMLESARAAGANEILPKPIDRATLIEMVRRIRDGA